MRCTISTGILVQLPYKTRIKMDDACHANSSAAFDMVVIYVTRLAAGHAGVARQGGGVAGHDRGTCAAC